MNKKLIVSLSIIAMFLIGFIVYQSITGIEVREVNLSEQQLKINEYANPDSLITAEALKELLADESKDVVVIGTMKEADKAIPGSYVVWRPDYSGTKAFDYGGMANTKEEMETLLSNFGVKEDTTIVTYAANDQHDSARLFWQLKLLGHKDVRLLDGGINVWIGLGYETTEPMAIGDRPKTEYKAPNYDPQKFNASIDVVANAIDNTDYVIIDTRAEDEEKGAKTLNGAFGPGKIKGSVWIEYSKATKENGTFKPLEELEALYKNEIASNKEIIAYCQSGVRSAYTWFVFTQILGYEEVLNYDGSWIEWSYNAYELKNEEIIAQTENGDFK